MQGFEKILEYIKSESERECKEIAVRSNDDIARIRALYSQKEQEAYWATVNKGTKEIEERVAKLTELATDQAAKMIHETQQDVLDDVLALTAKKLSTLPSQKYNALLTKLGVEQGCRPEYLVEQYRDELAPTVISALFDNRE